MAYICQLAIFFLAFGHWKEVISIMEFKMYVVMNEDFMKINHWCHYAATKDEPPLVYIIIAFSVVSYRT